MTFGAPEAEALYEGYAQKGFGFLSLGGSLFPLGSTATSEPTGVSKTLWIKKQGNTNKRKLITINNHSGDKRIAVVREATAAFRISHSFEI
jgi:hypothetical protein